MVKRYHTTIQVTRVFIFAYNIRLGLSNVLFMYLVAYCKLIRSIKMNVFRTIPTSQNMIIYKVLNVNCSKSQMYKYNLYIYII